MQRWECRQLYSCSPQACSLILDFHLWNIGFSNSLEQKMNPSYYIWYSRWFTMIQLFTEQKYIEMKFKKLDSNRMLFQIYIISFNWTDLAAFNILLCYKQGSIGNEFEVKPNKWVERCLSEEGGCDARGFLDFLFVFTGNGGASGFPFRTCFSNRKNTSIYFYLFLPPVVSTFSRKVKRERKSTCFSFLFFLP
jgi:hypothetical protein